MGSLKFFPLLGLLLTYPAVAQFSEAFTDGELHHDPAWTGTLDRWIIDLLEDSPALRSNGLPEADTLFLATPSTTAYGSWSFTFAHRDVNLSTANGVRLYLVADQPDLAGPVRGYFVQLGTNNSDEIRLYRQDGDPGTLSNRTEIGRSAAPVLAGDDQVLTVRIARSSGDVWTVTLGGDTLFTAHDSQYTTSAAFGVWLKHAQSTGQAFFLDDLAVTGHDAVRDDLPPRVIGQYHDDVLPGFAIRFSEPLAASSLSQQAVTIDGPVPSVLQLGTPAGGPPDSEVKVVLSLPPAPGEYALHIAGVTDRAGNPVRDTTVAVAVAAGSPARPSPEPGAIVINEVFYAPPAGVPEFIEVLNRTEQTYDLSSISLADDRGAPVPISHVPIDLAPAVYAVLTPDTAALRLAFPGVVAHQVAAWPALNNSGDAAVLLARATRLDSVAYRPAWGDGPASLERRDPAGPSNAGENWGSSVAPRGGTPGRQNSLYAPDETAPLLVFAEAVEDVTVDAFFNERLDAATVMPSSFHIGSAFPRQALLLPDEQTVRLTFHDSPTGHALEASAVRDATGNVCDHVTVPVAWLPEPGSVVVNEIMFDPLADRYDQRPNQPEYVELLNVTGKTLSLNGLYWTNRPDERGLSDTLRAAPERTALPPHGFSVVYAASMEPVDPLQLLAAAFPGADLSAPGVTLLPVGRATLGLRNDGDLIRVHRADGTVLDQVDYDPRWHAVGLLDTKGTALERLDVQRPSGEPSNWTSSVALSGGTPGQPNSVTRRPMAQPLSRGLTIHPSPFSPDGDGRDDVAFLSFRLAADVALVRTRIFDAHGRLVRTLEGAGLAGGSGQLVWDGRDDEGRPLRIGIYVVLLEAVAPAQGRAEAYKQPVVLARPLH